MNDKCYFEMNETEANLKNMMNALEFANYQIATGNIFAVGETAGQENVDKIFVQGIGWGDRDSENY